MRRPRAGDGFGPLELLIAMIVLNIGIFALVGTFNGVSVVVYDPHNSSHVLASDVSIFVPASAP